MEEKNEGAGSPLRLMIFDERPDCLVIYLARGASLRLPEIPRPFNNKAGLSQALAAAGVDYRITTGTPGQWIKAHKALHLAERAERGQRDAEALAAKNALRRASAVPASRDRAAALEQKLAIDQEIRALKAELGRAKAQAFTTGRYMPVDEYRAKERRLTELKEQSQALQVQIGKLRRAESDANAAQYRTYSEKFMRAAHEILTEDVLQRVHGLAVQEEHLGDEGGELKGEG